MRKVYKWNKEEDEKLKKLYPTASVLELVGAFPGIKMHALHEYARKRGLKRLVKHRKGTLQPLLSDSLEAYYWAGFIAADGWISKTGQVVVFIDELDIGHLQKLANFLNTKISHYSEKKCFDNNSFISSMVRVAVQDAKLGIEFAKKFDLKFQKTYNPPSIDVLDKFSNEQILSFMVGFIDGDGSIYSKNDMATLRIQNHASWIDIHRFFLKKIQNIFSVDCGSVSIDKRGYSLFSICTKKCISLIFDFITIYQIPYLERKWNKLNEKT